jgi:hypothetical protein
MLKEAYAIIAVHQRHTHVYHLLFPLAQLAASQALSRAQQ